MAGKGQMAREYRDLRDRLFWAKKRHDSVKVERLTRELEQWKDRKFRREAR